MTLDDLNALVRDTAWFSRLAEPDVENIYIRIPTLAPWGNEPTGDEALERIADQMEWLPSSRDQDDPIHGHSLEKRAEALGQKQAFSQQSLEIYKSTLAAL